MSHTLEELVVGITPIVIEETRAFWEATAREELVVQRCNACSASQLPGGPCCTTCWSQDLAWARAAGTGAIFSFTIVRHAFHPTFAAQVPYIVADVELDEGPIITTNVTDVDVDAVRIGQRVRVWFDAPIEDAFHTPLRLPKFRPED